MGQNIQGSTKFKYQTKQKIPIQYIFLDLKGHVRFPPTPTNDQQIKNSFDQVLRNIIAPSQHFEFIKELPMKYKYRFVVKHKRLIQQYKLRQQKELIAKKAPEKEEINKKKQLNQKLDIIQQSKSVLKVQLLNLDKFINQNFGHNEFIQVDGVNRLLKVLTRQVRSNKEGTKTNFSNQIQILKFLKLFSQRHQKQYIQHIASIKNYLDTIIKAYHPVNVAVTAYCLSLFQDYVWRVEQGQNVVDALKKSSDKSDQSFLKRFGDTLQNSNNILMIYYNLKFMNELTAAVIQQDQKTQIQNQRLNIKYEIILENIKAKFQEGFYKLDYCTFTYVHQQIYQYATSQKKIDEPFRTTTGFNSRNTMNLQTLQYHLLATILESTQQQDEKQSFQDDQQLLTVYLNQSGKKQFNKYVFQTLTQIQSYYKLQIFVNPQFQDENGMMNQTQINQTKMDQVKLQDYIKHIRTSCIKNGCNDQMLSVMKNLQYFQKIQWKRLQIYVKQEMGLSKKSDQIDNLKKAVEEKQLIVKKLYRQNQSLKLQKDKMNQQIDQYRKRISDLQVNMEKTRREQYSQAMIGISLPPPKQQKKLQFVISSTLPQSSNNSQSISNSSNIKLPPPPSLNQPLKVNLPPPPTLNSVLSNNISNTSNNQNKQILPPPPSLNNIKLPPPPPTLNNTSLNNNVDLPPPPPLMPNLPTTNLTSPPSLNNIKLPPPPPLMPNLPTTNLSPPPSLNNIKLPPPPPTLNTNSLSTNLPNLPPPPPLTATISLGNLPNLPPPPSLNTGLSLGSLPNLPPPPNTGLLPSPSLSNSLPPPPSISGGLISLPSLPGGLPSLPGVGLPAQSNIKTKQKKKTQKPLKTCNYATLAYDKIKDSIWEKVDDQKVNVDVEQLIQLFAKDQPIKKIDDKLSSQQNSSAQSPTKKQKIKFLGADKWRNVQIVLTKLKIPWGKMSQALRSCSGKYASSTVLQSISKILPSQQEEQMVASYQGDLEQLGRPERFYKQIIQVKQYKSRITSMIFGSIKEQFYVELQSKIDELTTAFISLKQNYRLHRVLEVALAIGNYLNGTSFKGGAWGFKLDSLQRMQQIKSKDNKMNAAFYVIKQVWKDHKYPIFDKEQIDLYQSVTKMPVSQIQIEISQLKKYVIALDKAIKSLNADDNTDMIGEFCEQIKNQADYKLSQFQQKLKKLDEAYKQCARFYCQDQKKPSDQAGKKIYKAVLFISNTEKTFKVVEQRWKKQQSRKATKNQMTFNDDMKKVEVDKKNNNPESAIKSAIIVNNLPKPPAMSLPSKQERLKQFEKSQLQREKKALQEVIKKRISKMTALRNSKLPMNKNINDLNTQQISFLKNLS